jgi:hypothetical protein
LYFWNRKEACRTAVSRERHLGYHHPFLCVVLAAMDLANGRDDALNGGVGVEETRRRRRKVELVQEAIHGFLEEKRSDGQGEEKPLTARQEEQELLSSLLTKVRMFLCSSCVWNSGIRIVADALLHAVRSLPYICSILS